VKETDELLRWFRRTRALPIGRLLADVGRPARHQDLARVEEDLRAVGVEPRFRFVWAADGSGVEEDDPHVIHIHRNLLGAADAPRRMRALADRVLSLDIASVARHEIGHGLLFMRPAAARSNRFRDLFGDVREAYRVGDPVDEVERRLRRHGGLANPRYRRVVSLYAATHAHERFAEAVRVVLAARGDEATLRVWAERHRVGRRVGDQLAWTAEWLRGYDQPARRSR
jgi:hypothetical protein